MATNDGGPAFPVEARLAPDGNPDSYWTQHPCPGMSLRDYLAAQSLVMAGVFIVDSGDEFCLEEEDEQSVSIARRAYKLADAMLRERSRQ